MAAHPDVVVILCSTYDAADLPPGAAASGAAAYVNKERLAADTIRQLWEERNSGSFVSPAELSSSGIEPRTWAPWPGCDSQRTVPPIAPRRSAMLTKPWPPRAATGSKPGPSSTTENSRPPDSSQTRTSTLACGACLPAFCSASRQQK